MRLAAGRARRDEDLGVGRTAAVQGAEFGVERGERFVERRTDRAWVTLLVLRDRSVESQQNLCVATFNAHPRQDRRQESARIEARDQRAPRSPMAVVLGRMDHHAAASDFTQPVKYGLVTVSYVDLGCHLASLVSESDRSLPIDQGSDIGEYGRFGDERGLASDVSFRDRARPLTWGDRRQAPWRFAASVSTAARSAEMIQPVRSSHVAVEGRGGQAPAATKTGLVRHGTEGNRAVASQGVSVALIVAGTGAAPSLRTVKGRLRFTYAATATVLHRNHLITKYSCPRRGVV